MKNENTQAIGATTTVAKTALGTTTSVTYQNKYSRIVQTINGNYNGGKDRVTPNPFWFAICTAGWGHENTLNKTVAYSDYAYQSITGPFLPPGYDLLANQYFIPDWNRIDNAAMAKIYDQLRGNSNLIVDLLESGSTVKMVKSVLRLKKFVLEFVENVIKHRRFKRVPKGPTQNQRRLDYVNGKWLEVRYGWMPLVNSIYDAADTINRDLRQRTIYVKGRSGMNQELKYKQISGDRNNGVYLTDYFASYRREYGFYFNIPGGPKISDWTSLNPLGIAYELMTLSFVLDWVVDIGGYLSLWENNALFSKHFKMGYVTDTSLEAYTHNVSSHAYQPWVYDSNGKPVTGYDNVSSKTGFIKRVRKNRERVLSLPTPPGITVKVRFGTLHQLDSIALFSQLIGKRLRGK